MLPITLLEYKMLPITLLEYKMLPITLLEYKMLHIYDFPDLFWNCSDAVVFFVIIYLNTTFQTLAILAITWMYVNLFIVIFSHLYFCMHYDWTFINMSSRIIGSIDPNYWNVCSIGIPIQNLYDQVKYSQKVWSYMPLEILKCQRHTTYISVGIYHN